MRMIIGSRVKQARNAKGFSQTELGNMLKVSKVSICGYERGTRIPTLDNFIRLADALDVSLDFLMGRDISVVSDETEYAIKIAKEDLEIIKAIKDKTELYAKLVENTSRMIDLIDRKIK